MSEMFSGIAIAASGMNAYQTWLEAISDNVSNIGTITGTDETPFQERMVVVQAATPEIDGAAGVKVVDVARSESPGLRILDRNHPLADENGMVLAPDMHMEDLLTDLIVAQRSYQANVSVFERARDFYMSALEIGR